MVGHHLPAEVMREHLAHAEAEAEGILASARAAAERHSVELDAVRESGSLDKLPTLLARHARYTDLTVIGQPNLETGGVDDMALTEAAFMDSGHPALVIPRGWSGTLPPQRALIAWDGSREAARAATDAIPLLQLAEHVLVLVIDERDLGGRDDRRPGEELAAHLRRHAVKAEVRSMASDSAAVTEVLLAQAREQSADLLVMGGYGHSRLREMLIGGTTRSHSRAHDCAGPVCALRFAMLESLTSLFTLTVLEVVLSIDNLVVIAVLVGKLPKDRQANAALCRHDPGPGAAPGPADLHRLDHRPDRADVLPSSATASPART